MDGNYPYLEQAEQDIAAFHGAENGLLLGSAFEANVAVWTALPCPGDVIVYDRPVHASTHEGMRRSRATQRIEFQHNDVENFRETLLKIWEKQPLIREGKCSVLVAVESIYSMDGDICPLKELIDVGKGFCNAKGDIQFIVDEAHSVGVIGPNGSGLVCHLGLEKEVAVVVHSFGKAMGSTGGMFLSLADYDQSIGLHGFDQQLYWAVPPSGARW
jgi:8-amino-7-oxononanoate synthase